jgi:hypothetical protein
MNNFSIIAKHKGKKGNQREREYGLEGVGMS